MNQCYMCGAEAVSRCYTCGQLICDRHGSENCQRCDTGVVAGDPRPEHFSAMPLPAAEGKHGWWRPQPAEEFVPPACYACQGLSRRFCRNCHRRYCPEHAGRRGLCEACGRSARMGLLVFLLAIGMMLGLILLGALTG
jgi:hypothetical protein